ncbi:rhamnulokinase [Marisediminicola sp. LYQ134]|uniref:rhamnulokinase n=1 Tax=Marisediminicola sp. LYQ134 TaxID=3391061 RepID=UPI003983CDF8
MTEAVAAVDLGATSGRVIVGYVGDDDITLRHVARFANTPVRTADGLHWNILELYRDVVAGVATAARDEPGLSSIGIDSWAVDYALMRGGRMLSTPYHYRDERTATAIERTHSAVPKGALFAANGLQHLPFNTLFQFAADEASGFLDLADTALLIPDLIGFWFTGRAVAERTNASTTGLLDVRTREWNDDLIARLGVARDILPPLVDAGTTIGALSPEARNELGVNAARTLDVVAVGSHDTASAVVAVPATTPNFAYISCGTWGLVGVELDVPVLSTDAADANFTNEGGVDGRIRFLHNVMGLWLLSESVRHWQRDGSVVDLPSLLDAAAAVSTTVGVFDADDARLLPPGDMPSRIAALCGERGEPVPTTHAEVVRSIIESLAAAFAHTVGEASRLASKRVDVIHIVGGGSRNALLCQTIADRAGLPVLAGPVEATAIGNVLVQARARGLVTGDLEALRHLVCRSMPPRSYRPRTT